MGHLPSKSSPSHAEYSLLLPSTDGVYRGPALIQGELQIIARRKIRVEKEIRVDLIGQLIEQKNCSLRASKSSLPVPGSKKIFFIYSSPLVTSHQNGTARKLKKAQLTYPFRIPVGTNLPPTCQFKDFAISYHLQIYHDGHLIPRSRQTIVLSPPSPHANIPLSRQVTGPDQIILAVCLPKSVYSARDASRVPLTISISNPRQKPIERVQIQLMQRVCLNGKEEENAVFTSEISDIESNTIDKEIHRSCPLILPSHLPASYTPNGNAQLDCAPSIAIAYEFRLTGHIHDLASSTLELLVPVLIE